MKKTQSDFSEFIEIPQPTLSAYESGRNKPTVDVLINISQKCHISIDWLCGNDISTNIASFQSLDKIINLSNSASKTRDFSHADTEADFFVPEKKLTELWYPVISQKKGGLPGCTHSD